MIDYGVQYVGVRIPLLLEIVSLQDAVVRATNPFKSLKPDQERNLPTGALPIEDRRHICRYVSTWSFVWVPSV